jgi:addiction module HigA family antidote
MKNAAPRPGHKVATTRSVIRGLDPRIHRSSQKAFSKWMDCRIKSGNDAVFVEASAPDYHRVEEKPMPRPAIHPGEILADELNELEITPTELSRQLSVPPNRISQIIQGKRAITGDTALRLGHWFQTSAQFGLNLQSAYDLRVATDAIGREVAALPTKAARRRAGG